MRYQSTRIVLRRAATLVECAIIMPVTLAILMMIMVGSMGVFRYQEVASLAREGARYASTHGYQHRLDSGLSSGTQEEWAAEIYQNAIRPKLIGLDPSRLSYTVTWPDVVNQPGKPDNWPGSKVDVRVSYQWMPEWGIVGPITLSSNSSMPITN